MSKQKLGRASNVERQWQSLVVRGRLASQDSCKMRSATSDEIGSKESNHDHKVQGK